MTCEAYYSTHPEPSHGGDRCNNRDIEAGTARAYSLLAFSTTLFGVANLFVTGWTIKRWGIKSGLLISVFWPAIRLLVQNFGVASGGARGIFIMQASQVITILGGPAGYLLALNSYVAEVIEPRERTGALGKLQGCSFIGNSMGFLAGGIISDAFSIIAPFQVTFALFLGSCIYIILALPRIPPSVATVSTPNTNISRFFGPLKVFSAKKWVLPNGAVEMQYGTILLGLGVFLGVLATGFIPSLLQMFATDVYGFGTTENSYLVSLNSFIRGIFLMLVFPYIISFGRARFSHPSKVESGVGADEEEDAFPTTPNDLAGEALDHDEEPPKRPHLESEKETFEFDLQYSRYSLLADCILTGGATFVTHGWQLYLVAVLLPFASGTGASAKGTIIQMCSASERTDALQAITLVEMVARMLTVSIFGFVFAGFAKIGKPELVFACNAVSNLPISFNLTWTISADYGL